jgi:membrane protease YdiL (CAAX protease family)
MEDKGPPPRLRKFGFSFVATQTVILLLGIGLVYFLKIPLKWSFDKNQIATALIFSLPMLLLGILFTSPVGLGVDFIRKIFDRISESAMGPFIQFAPTWALGLVSLLAGFGEEILFRGVLQAKAGLVISACIFGLCHFVTFSFFAIATVIGGYFGAVYLWTGQNILAPVIIHALYDFVVLLLMRKALR